MENVAKADHDPRGSGPIQDLGSPISEPIGELNDPQRRWILTFNSETFIASVSGGKLEIRDACSPGFGAVHFDLERLIEMAGEPNSEVFARFWQ